MKAVTVYYAPSCAFSAATVSFLLLRGADARLINLELHPDENSRVEKALGRKIETPTLHIEDDWHIAPPLSDLKKLLENAGLADDASPHAKLKDAQEKKQKT